jgi:vacuolar-type H+-ATPase subunit E/Vma4
MENEKKSILEDAREIAERIEKAKEEASKILEEQKELQAKAMLGGFSSAGQYQKEPVKPEISPKEYAEAALKGKLLN